MTSIPQELNDIGELLRTQDNRFTDQPMFIVQERVEHPCDEDRQGHFENLRVVWYCKSTGEEVSETRARRLERVYQETFGSYVKPEGYDRCVMGSLWTYVTACFTEQGCKDFIARDGHNHGELRIYADGSYRNAEFRAVRNWLMSLPAKPLAHGHRDDWYLLANARQIAKAAYKRKPNWVLAMQLFATGANSAIQICKDAGIDPYGLTVDRSTQPSCSSTSS